MWLYYSKSGQHSIKGVAIQQLERKYIVAISFSCKKKNNYKASLKSTIYLDLPFQLSLVLDRHVTGNKTIKEGDDIGMFIALVPKVLQ